MKNNQTKTFYDIEVFNKLQDLTKYINRHLKQHKDDKRAAAVLGTLNGAMLLQGDRIKQLYDATQKSNK